MELTKVLISNYMPYAKEVIVARAFPGIDGLKPVHRRILYTMYKMGLLNGEKTKCSNIAGQTLKLHPHGDVAVYDALVRLVESNESLNLPYIDGKGNFGKVYSNDIHYAASRYTEAKLAEICKDVFDGIEEEAVPFIPNFDNSSLEPELLPVKFPSILVNPSSGIAVGMSSSIPCFNFGKVCDGTIAVLKGEVADSNALMDIIGAPDFSTGGHIHVDQKELYKLGKTGKGSLYITGNCEVYSNQIVLTEIPYNTTAEAIANDIEKLSKTDLKEVSNVSDEIDINGFRLVIELKRGADPRAVLKKLMVLTHFRTKMNFEMRVVLGDVQKPLGVYGMLLEWIAFRKNCINNLYKYRLNKALTKEHELEAWEKIKDSVEEVVMLITKNKDDDEKSKAILMEKWNLDEGQASYLLDIRLRMISAANVTKKLGELADVRQNILEYRDIISSDARKNQIIIDDLTRLKGKYGTPVKTKMVKALTQKDQELDKPEPYNGTVEIFITEDNYIKRIMDVTTTTPEEDKASGVKYRFRAKNQGHILVFTYSGECHKILIDDIDCSRGKVKDKVHTMAGIVDEKDIMFIDYAGDYTGKFSIVYGNGRGYTVSYENVSGKRRKYRSLYDAVTPGTDWITQYTKFFVITNRRKAAYSDIEPKLSIDGRKAFKVARLSGEKIVAIQPLSAVPHPEEINFDRYSRGYTVSIGDDMLWASADGEKKRAAKKEAEQREYEVYGRALEQAEQKLKEMEAEGIDIHAPLTEEQRKRFSNQNSSDITSNTASNINGDSTLNNESNVSEDDVEDMMDF